MLCLITSNNPFIKRKAFIVSKTNMLTIERFFPDDVFYVNPIVFNNQDYYEVYNIYQPSEINAFEVSNKRNRLSKLKK